MTCNIQRAKDDKIFPFNFFSIMKEYVSSIKVPSNAFIFVLCLGLPVFLNGCGTPLQKASLTGDIDAVRALLDSGVDANEKGTWSDTRASKDATALHAAAARGHSDVVRLLIENGADVNVKSAAGWTPLHEAVWGGQISVVRILIDADADPGLADNGGETALNLAESIPRPRIAHILNEAIEKKYGIPDRPGTDYVWIRGKMIRQGDKWYWKPGHWESKDNARRGNISTDTVIQPETSEPDWINGKIRCSGYAAIDTDRFSELSEAKLMAKRAAILDAKGKLLELLLDLKLDSGATVRDVVTDSNDTNVATNPLVRRAYLIDENSENSMYTVTVELKLSDAYEHIKTLN